MRFMTSSNLLLRLLEIFLLKFFRTLLIVQLAIFITFFKTLDASPSNNRVSDTNSTMTSSTHFLASAIARCLSSSIFFFTSACLFAFASNNRAFSSALLCDVISGDFVTWLQQITIWGFSGVLRWTNDRMMLLVATAVGRSTVRTEVAEDGVVGSRRSLLWLVERFKKDNVLRGFLLLVDGVRHLRWVCLIGVIYPCTEWS